MAIASPREEELYSFIRKWTTERTQAQCRIISELESELTDLQSTLEQAMSTNDEIKEQNAKLQSRLNQTELGIKYNNLLEAYNMAELEIKELKAKIQSLETPRPRANIPLWKDGLDAGAPVLSAASKPSHTPGQSTTTTPQSAQAAPACPCQHTPKIPPNLFDVLVKSFLDPSRGDYTRGC